MSRKKCYFRNFLQKFLPIQPNRILVQQRRDREFREQNNRECFIDEHI
jgi:hypothetical protein